MGKGYGYGLGLGLGVVAHRVGRRDALALHDHLDAAAYGELRGRDARLVGVRVLGLGLGLGLRLAVGMRVWLG